MFSKLSYSLEDLVSPLTLMSSPFKITVVDSGCKALEILGLHEDEQRNADIPSVPSTDLHKRIFLQASTDIDHQMFGGRCRRVLFETGSDGRFEQA
ncbi:hypothetical protein FEM48_Zijuj03G0020300 [Ziziphus jujuba var. spinosa]|uniref:Uncharacterized protein n=1 Tax=Ziziphus jujuba var. spinosa TaxID=714518 RepID=A0A978VMI1_ZIZJJ|nr:hypothetical protein FEM48_Zijuj03G0020300 [Ziziphus jujuba var. spinosa]